MNARFALAWLPILLVACATRPRDLPRSALFASRCPQPVTEHSPAGINIWVEEPRRLANSEYVQTSLFVVRDGKPDSLIRHFTGAFDSLPPLVPALYRIRVRALGYQTATDTVRVASGELWCVKVHLAEAIVLEPVF